MPRRARRSPSGWPRCSGPRGRDRDRPGGRVPRVSQVAGVPAGTGDEPRGRGARAGQGDGTPSIGGGLLHVREADADLVRFQTADRSCQVTPRTADARDSEPGGPADRGQSAAAGSTPTRDRPRPSSSSDAASPKASPSVSANSCACRVGRSCRCAGPRPAIRATAGTGPHPVVVRLGGGSRQGRGRTPRRDRVDRRDIRECACLTTTRSWPGNWTRSRRTARHRAACTRSS